MKKLLLQTGTFFLFVLTVLLFHAESFWVQAAEETTLEPVEYINRYYDEEKGEVISESEVCEEYKVLTAGMTTLNNGWYVVNGNVESSGDIEIRGDVRVIIEDGMQWALYNHHIHVTGTNRFTVYAGAGQTGELVVTKYYNDDGKASIGGDGADSVENGESCGTITFNGGKVTIRRGCGGTTIGTGKYGNGGRIVINAGTLSCLSEPNPLNGANIGSGTDGSGVEIEMNGGDVTAQGDVSVADSGYTLFGRLTDQVTMNGGFLTTRFWSETGTKKVSLITPSFTYNSGVVKNAYNQIITVRNMKEDVTIPENYVMTVAEDETLTVPQGVQLVNNGTICSYGTLINHGTITNNGTFQINEKITGTGTYTGTEALVAKNVIIPESEHISVSSGKLVQRVMPGDAMEEVVLTVEDGYEFAKGDVTQEYSGIKVIKKDLRTLVISGDLAIDAAEDVEITIPKVSLSAQGIKLAITVDAVAGEKLPDTVQIAENAGTLQSITYYLDGNAIADAASDGYEYGVKMIIEPAEGTTFSALTTAKINGIDAQTVINPEDGTAQITGIIPAVIEHGAFYIDRTYDPDAKKVVSELKECKEFHRLATAEWTDGWYYVTQNTGLWHVTVKGDVRLILADGVTLSVSDNIDVPIGSSLTIYGQENQTGTLNARNADRANYPAVGNAFSCGKIVINGGIIKARTYSSSYAGIGSTGAEITINGGLIDASSGYGYDIKGAKVLIHGGEITTNNKGIAASIEQNGGIWTDVTNNKVSAAAELSKDVEIAEGGRMTVPEGAVLTIPEGVALKNNGVLTVLGAVDNQGTWINNGTVRIESAKQLTGKDITDNGTGKYSQYLSADEIVVPSGLIYTGEDQTESVKGVIALNPDQTEGVTALGQTFEKDNNTDDWSYVIKKRGNVVNEVKEEGTYTVVYTYTEITIMKDFAIGRFELTEDMMSGIEDTYYFTGKGVEPVPVIASYDGTVFENGWDYQVTYENNTEPGTATMTVKGTTSCMGEFSTTFSIRYLEMPELMLEATEGKNGYYVSDVMLSSEGYQIAEVPSEDTAVRKLEWKDVLTYSEDGDYTKNIRFKNKSGAVTDVKNVTFKLDQTGPAANIRIGAKDYQNELHDGLVYQHYRLDRNEVLIQCEDQASQTASVEYLISQEKLTAGELASEKCEWQPYDEERKPSILNDTNQIVYVKTTDHAGNVNYAGTEGIYVDTVAPKVTELAISADQNTLKETQFTFSFRTDEAGSYFYAVLLADEDAPDADHILEMAAGNAVGSTKNSTADSKAAACGMGTVAQEDMTEEGTALVTEQVTGLLADTAYKVYVVVQDEIYDISKEARGVLAHNRSEVFASDMQKTAKHIPQDNGEKTENTTNNGNTPDNSNTSDNGNTADNTRAPGQTQPDTPSAKSDKRYRITGAATAEYAGPVSTDKKKVVIADTIEYNGRVYKVTSVAKNAFKNNKRITEVVVGKNVTTIKDQAFANAKTLKKVTLGKNTTKIGNNVFKGSKKLKTIIIKSTKLKKSGLKKNAFKGITSKTTIKVPKKKVKTYRKLFQAAGLGKKVKVK